MTESELEIFRKVVRQRDALHRAMAELEDRLRHGVYNGVLGSHCHRRPDEDPTKACDKGHSRREVLWGMGRHCLECDRLKPNCHLSYEEREIFQAMDDAEKLLNEPAAEMPAIKPESFPVYDPQADYAVTDRWLARQFYRLAVGYWCYANHKDIQEEQAWERAFDDTLNIALVQMGLNGKAFRLFINATKTITSNEEGKKFMEAHPEITDLVNQAAKKWNSPRKKPTDVETLVMHALMLRIEYKFGHDYPGGDMDVYDGVFCGLIDDCLQIAGLCPDDRPASGDFEDKDVYQQVLLEYKAQHKEKLYAFMQETDGFCVKEPGKETT